MPPWACLARRRSPARTVRRHNHAWFDDIVARLRFERDARRTGMTVQSEFVGQPRRLRYRFAVDVPVHDDRRLVTVGFEPVHTPSLPVVHIDGPVCLRHRWADGSLCMWLDSDPPEERWVPADGLLGLVGQIELHSYCEAECRAGRPWAKPESPGRHARRPECPSCPRR